MRKVILFNMVSLDGYFEGPQGELDWHKVDGEFNEFAVEQLDAAGALLFGRVTYQLMAGYWPTPIAAQNDPAVAEKMNRISKIVFSKTLDKAEWENTRLVNSDAVAEIVKLKKHEGKHLFLLGSSYLATDLAVKGLIDEYRIMVNPIFLGDGVPLLKGLPGRVKLNWMKTKVFHSGNVLLYYSR